MEEEIINGINYTRIRNKVLSYSSLKQFKKSPEHFVQYINQKFAPSPAMVFGSLLDKMVLTPGTWQEDFIIKPVKTPLLKDLVEEHGKEVGRQKYNESKENYEVWIKENAGKTFITKEQIETAEKITEKVFKNESAKELLNRVTQTQRRVEFTDKATGLKICGYEDGKGEGLVMDLKSCLSADPEDFIRHCLKLDYHLQAAVYLEAEKHIGFEFPEYNFLAVETSEPHGICVMRASDEFIELGKLELRTLLDNFKYCLDNKLFHQSYEFRNKFGNVILELPYYLKKKLE